MRTVLASRLLVAAGLGFVGTVAAPGIDRPSSPQAGAALQPPAPEPFAAHGPPASPAARATRPAVVPAPPARPLPMASPRPRPRSVVVHHASPPKHVAAPTARPQPQPQPKPQPQPQPKPKPKPSPPPPPSSGASNNAYESRILSLVNAQRASHGLSGLSMSSCADSYAERWSVHLAAIGTLVHQSMLSLLTGCHAQAVGENIGFGAVSADTMMAMWMASPGHRANLLNPRFTSIGIGAVQIANGTWYATQDFLDL